MKCVRVSLKERSYEILIGSGLIAEAGKKIQKLGLQNRRAIIVSQKEIASHHLDKLHEALHASGFETRLFLTPTAKSSEAAKSREVFLKLLSYIASQDGKNQSLFLIAFGGGVIGDLTGFAASVYRRGIPCIQIPTTLTAQVDSAIGGKNGIDLPEGKNLLGTIYQPSLVLCDPDLCRTLPERYLHDGFAEVIKYGVIKDPRLFDSLEKEGIGGVLSKSSLFENIIYRCVSTKAGVVSQDEFDAKEIRMILNFGHTAGHAIEKVSGYSKSYTHGESVAVGMLIACDIAKKMGLLKDESLPDRLEKTLLRFNLPVFYRGLLTNDLINAMGYDKKSSQGKNRWVLPQSLGRTAIYRDIPRAVITWALERRKR
jgi:3-dehydroquinate synthase